MKRGFTLIELSIVLVIIGLIVGGVLVGRDLIKAAEIRKTIAEIDKVNVAATTFRLKYNCMAGDCKNATQFFGASSQPDQVTNGDGNGKIEADNVAARLTFVTGTDYSESAMFFDHLANSKLIAMAAFDETAATVASISAGNGFPKTPVGNGFMIMHNNPAPDGVPSSDWVSPGIHSYVLGVDAIQPTANYLSTQTSDGSKGLITAPDAFAIDNKLDDGLPRSGTVVALTKNDGDDGGTGGYLSQPDTPGSGSCASDATGNPYSMDTNDSCALSIKTAF